MSAASSASLTFDVGRSCVTNYLLHCRKIVGFRWVSFDRHMRTPRDTQRGLTLPELLCVIAIIAILLALYLPAISRAFVRVKDFLSGFG